MPKYLLFLLAVSAFGQGQVGGVQQSASGSMTWPAAPGIAVYAGSQAWGTSLNPAAFLAVYNVVAYGAVCDGTTDDTAALNNAILAAYNAHGGTVFIPNGNCLIAGQINIPNDNTALSGEPTNPYSRQPNLRITGVGDMRNGEGQVPGAVYGGSMLKLTYSGSGYKIQTFGLGSLEMDHLTFYDPAGDSVPFFLTTGTTVNIHDNAFIGSKGGQTADQDVLTFGGSNITFSLNSPTAAYQGYDSTVINNYFNYVRRVVYAKTYVASLYVSDNFIGPGTGSNLTDGAAIEFDGTAFGENTVDNYIVNNRCEISGYYYCMKFLGSQSNYIAGTDVEDAHSSYNTAVYYFDANAGFNTVMLNSAPNSGGMTYLTHVIDLTVNTSTPLGENLIIDSTQSAPSRISQGPLQLNSLATFGTVDLNPNHTTATSTTSYPSTGANINGYYWDGAASQKDTWNLSTLFSPSSGANPNSYLSFSHSGTSGLSAVKFPTQTQFGASNQTTIDSSGNISVGSAVYIYGSGLLSSTIQARSTGQTLSMIGRQTAGSGSPSVSISTTSGLNATDTAVELGANDGGKVDILKNGNVIVAGTLKMLAVLPGILYSAAGTALPSCASGINGEHAVVSDATTPTYMGAYASGGGITAAVICSYNGSAYSWLTH
jgi:hypothetical protein